VSGGSESCAASAPAKVLLSSVAAKPPTVRPGATRVACANHFPDLRPPRRWCSSVVRWRLSYPVSRLAPRPFASAVVRLLLALAPPLAPPRCHPDPRPSAVPNL